MTDVSLMITCLGDMFRPQAGVSTVKLLRRLGVRVAFPPEQTCCGQPFYNSGVLEEARALARRTIGIFADGKPVVCPSGSCAAMVKLEYPHLLHDDDAWSERAAELASRTFELSDFLVNRLGAVEVGARYSGKVTYHYACHLRGLGLRSEAERLIRHVEGVEFVPLPNVESCCGFGGSFAVRYPHISGGMVGDKVESILATGAGLVVSTDTGCLMNIGGALRRRAPDVRCVHLAELLAGEAI